MEILIAFFGILYYSLLLGYKRCDKLSEEKERLHDAEESAKITDEKLEYEIRRKVIEHRNNPNIIKELANDIREVGESVIAWMPDYQWMVPMLLAKHGKLPLLVPSYKTIYPGIHFEEEIRFWKYIEKVVHQSGVSGEFMLKYHPDKSPYKGSVVLCWSTMTRHSGIRPW